MRVGIAVLVCVFAVGGCSAGGDGSGGPSGGSTGSDGAASSADSPGSSAGSPSAGVSHDPSQPKGGEVPPKKPGDQSNVIKALPGSTTSKCVTTAGQRDLRSGTMGAGPFDTARADYGTKRPGVSKDSVRLYWIPQNSKSMPGLVLQGRNLDTGRTISVKETTVGDAEDWRFYDTNVRLPEPGRWRLTASSGSQRGCFDLTVGRTAG